jgi:protein-tyrosine phosphatase
LMPAGKGKTVAWGKIYRSADISKLTDSDLATVGNLNLGTVCDLRGPDELKNNPDKLPAGINYVNLPAGSEQVRTNTNYAAMNRDSMMRSFYSRTDHLVAKYKPMFDELLSLPADKSLMFHCTAGKDRTGVGAALILSALGVPQNYVVADYAATNVFWTEASKKMLPSLMQNGMDEKTAKSMLAADPAYIGVFLETINQKYGSMEKFLKNELQLDKKKIKALRKAYLI